MPPERVERGAEPTTPVDDLPRWMDRIGAAVVAPRTALAISDTAEGRGRASSDVAILLLLALVAVETSLFAMAGWSIWDGDWSGALTVIMVGAKQRLAMPIVLLFGATVALTIIAGRRRSPADDFDLVSVALVPLVLVELLHTLLAAAGLDIRFALIYFGYGWSVVLWGLAYLQTRSRSV